MSTRRSFKLPITLAIVMIVLLIALIVLWVIATVSGALSAKEGSAVFYWTVLTIGTTFLALVLLGVVAYLALSIKAISVTRQQSNFIDAVTHELKSPIASLKLILQTLDLRQVSDEKRESFQRFMLDDVERLDQLINHVLEAGRVDKEPVDGESELVEMPALLRDCASTVCSRYKLPQSILHLELAPCTVQASRLDLEIVFRNLIDNAVKYAGSPPRVEITLDLEPDGTVVTRICDNGAGIPYQLRRKIFGRFVRLGLELERKKPGTGLGLYIVRNLVRRMRGQVRVFDPAEGTGTVFEVRLPDGTSLGGNSVPSAATPIEEATA